MRIKTTLTLTCVLLGPSLISMGVTGQPKPSAEETQIRKRLDDWTTAFRRKDIDAVMLVFAPEAVAFDLVPPLQYRGRDTYRKQWERLFASYEGPIDYEIRELSITAEHDVAFSHSLNRIGGTLTNGKKAAFWIRMTACWRKVGGQWLIAHEHVSVPVDLEKDRPVLDLSP
jgi:uncharacterized protein (TIGR02246 family)